MSNDAKDDALGPPTQDDTVPDDLPSVQVLEAAEHEERKDTEALLASFDKPLGKQRSLEGRDFVEYYTTRRGEEPPRVSRPSPFDAPPKPLPDTARRPGQRRAARPLALIGLGFVIVTSAGVLAFVAAGPESAAPPAVSNANAGGDLPSGATSRTAATSAAHVLAPPIPEPIPAAVDAAVPSVSATVSATAVAPRAPRPGGRSDFARSID